MNDWIDFINEHEAEFLKAAGEPSKAVYSLRRVSYDQFMLGGKPHRTIVKFLKRNGLKVKIDSVNKIAQVNKRK